MQHHKSQATSTRPCATSTSPSTHTHTPQAPTHLVYTPTHEHVGQPLLSRVKSEIAPALQRHVARAASHATVVVARAVVGAAVVARAVVVAARVVARAVVGAAVVARAVVGAAVVARAGLASHEHVAQPLASVVHVKIASGLQRHCWTVGQTGAMVVAARVGARVVRCRVVGWTVVAGASVATASQKHEEHPVLLRDHAIWAPGLQRHVTMGHWVLVAATVVARTSVVVAGRAVVARAAVEAGRSVRGRHAHTGQPRASDSHDSYASGLQRHMYTSPHVSAVVATRVLARVAAAVVARVAGAAVVGCCSSPEPLSESVLTAMHAHEGQPWSSEMSMLTAPGLQRHARKVGHWLGRPVVAGRVSLRAVVSSVSVPVATHAHEGQPWSSVMSMLVAPGLHLHERTVGHCSGRLEARVVARPAAVVGSSEATHAHEGQPWSSVMSMLKAPGLQLHARTVGHIERALMVVARAGREVGAAEAGWSEATHAHEGQPCSSVTSTLVAPGLQLHERAVGHWGRVSGRTVVAGALVAAGTSVATHAQKVQP